jgi:hypothetical protein
MKKSPYNDFIIKPEFNPTPPEKLPVPVPILIDMKGAFNLDDAILEEIP